MTQDDSDDELCNECLSASGAEIRAPIPTESDDLVDYIEEQDDHHDEQLIEDAEDVEDDED